MNAVPDDPWSVWHRSQVHRAPPAVREPDEQTWATLRPAGPRGRRPPAGARGAAHQRQQRLGGRRRLTVFWGSCSSAVTTGRSSRPASTRQVRLTRDELDVTGSPSQGVPGVQHFGHAGGVAWAITNAMADYGTSHAETLRRTAGGWKWSGDGWEPAEEGDGWLRTRRGPVFAGSVAEGGPRPEPTDAEAPCWRTSASTRSCR